jgi:hypothetical protein
MRRLSNRSLALLTSMLFLALGVEALAGITSRRPGRARRAGKATAQPQARPRLESFTSVQQARSFLNSGVTRISQALECNC